MPNTPSLKVKVREFNKKFPWPTFCWNEEYFEGRKAAKNQKRKVTSWLVTTLSQVQEEAVLAGAKRSKEFVEQYFEEMMKATYDKGIKIGEGFPGCGDITDPAGR